MKRSRVLIPFKYHYKQQKTPERDGSNTKHKVKKHNTKAVTLQTEVPSQIT